MDEVSYDGNNDIYLPPCQAYLKEQWIGIEVALLNDCDTPLTDGVCRNINPKGCVDANPLGDEDVEVSIFNSLVPMEVPPSWRFFF